MGILSQILNAVVNVFILRKQEKNGRKITWKDNVIPPTSKILIAFVLAAVFLVIVLKLLTLMIGYL